VSHCSLSILHTQLQIIYRYPCRDLRRIRSRLFYVNVAAESSARDLYGLVGWLCIRKRTGCSREQGIIRRRLIAPLCTFFNWCFETMKWTLTVYFSNLSAEKVAVIQKNNLTNSKASLSNGQETITKTVIFKYTLMSVLKSISIF